MDLKCLDELSEFSFLSFSDVLCNQSSSNFPAGTGHCCFCLFGELWARGTNNDCLSKCRGHGLGYAYDVIIQQGPLPSR
jgi:hypothetical protein